MWYYGRGFNGDLWANDWLRQTDGIVSENKRVRLYTYIDDIEGRRYNDEESDEVGEKPPEENKDTQETAE